MYNPEKIWNDFWKYESCEPIFSKEREEYKILYGGTNYEPDASIGMSCFLEPVRENFKEGFRILDYGCGAGILANFISLRLKNFSYVGLEPSSQHGLERINLAKHFLNDSRVHFSFIEKEKLNDLYKENFDCIILISVFTHLTIEETYKTLDLLLPFIKNKTKIIFSCFISNSYELIGRQENININFFNIVKITEQQILEYVKNNNLKLTKVCDFIAAGNHCHNIYTLEANND
jgi:2-polyprenyl-3-methyl-5-hydroxy-6-metoxy-1,4-benzoquinol methylase